MKRIDITAIKAVVNYDPETGEFTRIKSGRVITSKDKDGYIRINIGNARYSAHRVAWALHNGEDPGDITVDHINGVVDDNRACNLRRATASQQSANKRGSLGIGKRYFGWIAQTKHQGRNIWIGTYDCPLMARLAYEDKMRELHGEYACV